MFSQRESGVDDILDRDRMAEWRFAARRAYPRELEVLQQIAEGRSNAAIARAMVITPGAVEKHISNIFSRLSLPASDDDHRRVLAVLGFLQAQ